MLGSFGLMTRQGPGTIEIGYWVHVDADRPRLGDAREPRAHQRALAVDGITTVYIRCDERNSAARRPGGSATARQTLTAPEAPANRAG